MTDFATRFRTILSGLMAFIATVAAKDRPRADFLVRIHHHLNRTIQRFERLATHWRNNTLPKQRSRPGRPARPQAAPRLPTGKAWLQRALNHYLANGHAAQLQHFLTTEDCQRFLAEVPRALRILRPLARSLGLLMPGDPPPPPPKSSFTPDPPGPWPVPALGIVVHPRGLLADLPFSKTP
jgi:hypothetical protein